MNKIWLAVIPLVIVAGVLVIKNQAVKKNANTPTETKTAAVSNAGPDPCKEENVSLPNYGDPGKQLKNCFVQYPGESSRQDKSYYIVEDICGQFTQKFIEGLLGRSLVKIEGPKVAGLNNCSYYTSDTENFLINLEYLSIENQKTGNEFAGYKAEKNEKIPMDNLVVTQEDGALNVIYLVLNPNKFISIRPVSKTTFAGNDEFMNLAIKLGGAIKEYK